MSDREVKDRDPIKFDIDQEWGDYIIEEGGNTSLNLRMISWNDRGYKLDLRKYAFRDGQERAMKGVTLTEDGANELTQVLVSKGYGDTYELVKALSGRSDFEEGMLDPEYQKARDTVDEEFHDPKELLASSSDDE